VNMHEVDEDFDDLDPGYFFAPDRSLPPAYESNEESSNFSSSFEGPSFHSEALVGDRLVSPTDLYLSQYGPQSQPNGMFQGPQSMPQPMMQQSGGYTFPAQTREPARYEMPNSAPAVFNGFPSFHPSLQAPLQSFSPFQPMSSSQFIPSFGQTMSRNYEPVSASAPARQSQFGPQYTNSGLQQFMPTKYEDVSMESPSTSPRGFKPSSSAPSTSTQFELEEEDSNDDMDISRNDNDESGAGGEDDSSPLSWNGQSPINVVLPPSKTPCLDALAFCLIMKLGADITEEDKEKHTITIYDCFRLLSYIKHFCPKQNQTSNNEARVKALKRWFNGIPAKKRRTEVFKIEMKPDKRQAIKRIIKKLEQFAQKEGLVGSTSIFSS